MKTPKRQQNKLGGAAGLLIAIISGGVIYETASALISGEVFEETTRPHCIIVWLDENNNVVKSWQCSSKLHWFEENGLRFVDSSGRKVEIQGNIKVYGKYGK